MGTHRQRPPEGFRRSAAVLLPALLAALTARPARGGVVISEIHYAAAPDQVGLELVEVSNDTTTPVELSGFAFVEGISFTFPQGTVLGSRGSLVVAEDAGRLGAAFGIDNVAGTYTGSLNATGERLTLVNRSGIVVSSVRYRDRGAWPTGPAGSGFTLSLRRLTLEPEDPASWTQSAERGGTPGRPNFQRTGGEVLERVLLGPEGPWRFARGTGPFSTPETTWRTATFDDGAWPVGPGPFGFGYDQVSTPLADMRSAYTSLAIRGTFELTAEDLRGAAEFYLAVDFDDGACAFLGGEELVRWNCGDYGVERAWNDSAGQARTAGKEEIVKLPRARLVAGRNVVALLGFNQSLSNSDFFLSARVIERRPIQPPPPAPPGLFLNELFRGARPGQGWVEVYNPGPTALPLGGFRLTNNPGSTAGHSIPDGTTIGPGGFLVLTEEEMAGGASAVILSANEVKLFLLTPDGVPVDAAVFDRAAPETAGAEGYVELRFPDGGPLAWVGAVPTRGARNVVERTTSIVLNEILYHPPEERRGELIELFNRGSEPVNLSGFRFTRGIEYTFPPGTVLGPGAYLVVSEDPALVAQHYGLQGVLGPWVGQLANTGETILLEDRSGNEVDSVTYEDGGEWSHWADGGGASLELVDPEQDNSRGAAWEASDELEKTTWEELSFQVPDHIPAAESELHLFLPERGVVRVDDLSITQNGGPNLVPNPGFEAGTQPWVIQGTHVASARIDTDRRSGTACLEISASGKGDTLVNRIEVDTSPALTSGPHEVRLWARWVRGSSLLVIHGEYAQGVEPPASIYSANTLSRGLRLTVPWNIGSPGAENSVRRLRRAAGVSTNTGPVISHVRHSPAVPVNGDRVQVTALVTDPDGIELVEVMYARSNARGDLTRAPLRDDGQLGDASAGDGVYTGELPAAGAGTKVVYFLEARDARGNRSTSPAEAPERTFLYQVGEPQGEGPEGVRVVLDSVRTSELVNRPLHSNDLLDGALVLGDEEVYHNVGVRYRGSPWGRPDRNNYRVRFQGSRRFLRGQKAINLDSSGDRFREGAVYFLVRQNASPAVPTPVGDYDFVRLWFNGARAGIRSLHHPVDRAFVERWFSTADGALALKVEGRRVFNDEPDPTLVALDGANMAYRGEDPESYRNYFIPSIRQSVDDWAPLARLTSILDPRVSTDAQLADTLEQVLDLEGFLRVFVPRAIANETDGFPFGAGHNGYLVWSGVDSLWHYVGYDMDHTFGEPNPALVSQPTGDPYFARALALPGPRRQYLRILDELLRGYASRRIPAPYFDALEEATALSTAQVRTFLRNVETRALGQLAPYTGALLRFTTNLGGTITTDQAAIELSGEAPVQAAQLVVARNGDPPGRLDPGWTTPTAWKVTLALPELENNFEVFAFDTDGNLLGSTGITVLATTHSSGPRLGALVPSHGPVAGGTRVAMTAEGLAAGLRVFVGGMEAAGVEVAGPGSATFLSPAAQHPLPEQGAVSIDLRLPTGERSVVARAFTYTLEDGFLRGDVTNDGAVTLSDAVATLFHLYLGAPLLCADAADTNDDGTLNATDVIGILEALYRGGTPPAPPFPARGSDPTADALECPGRRG